AEVVIIKAIGIGLAIAVAIDATIVRSLVVPAVMRLLGDANWWAPRPLRWAYDRIGIGDLGVEPIGSPHPAATPPTSPASGEVKVAVGARGPSVWLRQTPPHGMGGLTIGPVPTLSSDDAFAEVKAKVDLVKVVQEHVRLTKRNKDFWGLCPFHQEDSPSFKVNPQMQSWYCFGCERSGDVFTFVELIEKTDKRGALQLLAERAGVELKKLSPDQRERADLRKRVLDMLKLAAQYYEYVLWKTPAGETGRRLLESRRVGEETARRFQLGYAPAGRGFAEYLRAKQRSLADAQEAGLMRRDGTDFFAERLVIPIRDERGQALAFTARTVRADEQRKYINSPETPSYIKGRVIFALDLARDEITRRGHAVLMEGQFD